MEVKALRRTQLVRESAGFLCLPAAYVALGLLGVFLLVPEVAALLLLLVGLLVLQLRSGALARAIARTASSPRRAAPPPAQALEEADRRFLRQVALTACANAGSFLVFLAGVDLHLRAQLAGAPAGAALALGAAAGIALTLAGREAARRASWRGFGALHPELGGPGSALAGGRATRSSAAYMEWRLSLEAPG